MDDAEAIDLVRQGDQHGAETLVARYQMRVYNLTLRMLGNAADAEDASQEVFLRAFRRLHQYRPGEPFGGWLFGIARHYSIDLLRRRPRSYDLGRPSSENDAESVALGHLERERIQAALQQLACRDRALLVLRYWEDQSIENIAETLGMSEGAARVALLRARRSLASMLKTSSEVATDAM